MGALRYNFDLIFANLLFGANFSFYVSLTRNYLDFQQIFMLQVLAASIFFIPFALFSKRSYRIPLRDFGNILIVTVLIVYGWMFMLLWGASYTSPIDASTISTLGPVFTILTGHFLLREKNITWARRIGVVLGFAGAAFLLFDKGFRLAPGSSGLGNALVLVAVVAIAVNTVIIKPQLQRYGTLVVMGWYYIHRVAYYRPLLLEIHCRYGFSAPAAERSGGAGLCAGSGYGAADVPALPGHGEAHFHPHGPLPLYPARSRYGSRARAAPGTDRPHQHHRRGVDFRQYYPGDPRS